MIDTLIGAFGIYLGTFAVGFVAGFVPVVNIELFLFGIAGWGIHDPAQIPFVVALATAGQMLSKVIVYYCTARAIDAAGSGKPSKRRDRIERLRARVEAWHGKRYWVLVASAALGFPPFLLYGVYGGMMRVRFREFFVIGTVGRVVRFTVIMVIPIKELLHALGSAVGC